MTNEKKWTLTKYLLALAAFGLAVAMFTSCAAPVKVPEAQTMSAIGITEETKEEPKAEAPKFKTITVDFSKLIKNVHATVTADPSITVIANYAAKKKYAVVTMKPKENQTEIVEAQIQGVMTLGFLKGLKKFHIETTYYRDAEEDIVIKHLVNTKLFDTKDSLIFKDAICTTCIISIKITE